MLNRIRFLHARVEDFQVIHDMLMMLTTSVIVFLLETTYR